MNLRILLILLPLVYCKFSPQFSSVEHASIPGLSPFITDGGLPIDNYGKIVALAFDYYGAMSKEEVICFGTTEEERDRRFKAIFDSFWTSLDQEKLTDALNVITVEYVASVATFPPSAGILGLSNKRWIENPSAVKIGVWNFDHFGDCARLGYIAGQTMAIAEQRIPNRNILSSSDSQKTTDLSSSNHKKAIAVNAFANHFSTDLFSSGHMRVPRIEIYKACGSAYSAALTAMRMHDEDSYNGLPVVVGDNYFMAYGDAFGMDSKSADNMIQMMRFVNASLSQVISGYQGNISDLLSTIPIPQSPEQNTSTTCPLYSVREDLLIRSPLNSLFVRPCPFRKFIPIRDCAGYGNTAITALSLLAPTSVVYDSDAGGWVSKPYSLNGGSRDESEWFWVIMIGVLLMNYHTILLIVNIIGNIGYTV